MDNGIQPVPFVWIEEGREEEAYTPRTRKWTKKKKEFVGWGSRQLIDFLKSLGRETSKVISQSDVTDIINQYVTEKELINPIKKKRVLCDDRLHALFGRKSVGRNKISSLLEAHLAEHQDDSDDFLFYSSEERGEENSAHKRRRVANSDRKTQPKKKVAEVSKTCLAAISPENIKLVYLKRTLVEELLKHSETFEGKVVGSFVRVKTDPYDIFQKNSHQLQLVTGVKAVAAAGDDDSCTLLHISGAIHEISISALSDDNFSEDECEDLYNRVKDGLIKQPTVGELEKKVGVLHEDVTRHWLTKELAHLKNLIDRANEKGWRPRVTEYLDRRRLLQTPSEQSRLLSDFPKVKAEELKIETLPDNLSDGNNVEDSPKVADWDWEPCYRSPTKGSMTKFPRNQDDQAKIDVGTRSNGHAPPFNPEVEAFPEVEARSESNGYADLFEPKETIFSEKMIEPKANGRSKSLGLNHINFTRVEETKKGSNGPLLPQISGEQYERHVGMLNENKQIKPVEVIDLSDDDDEEPEAPNSGNQISVPFSELLLWHYLDPQGKVQGPFSLASLKRWKDANFFPPSFRVWRIGHNQNETVLLNDILRQMPLN